LNISCVYVSNISENVLIFIDLSPEAILRFYKPQLCGIEKKKRKFFGRPVLKLKTACSNVTEVCKFISKPSMTFSESLETRMKRMNFLRHGLLSRNVGVTLYTSDWNHQWF
jgi:hypothetical protein